MGNLKIMHIGEWEKEKIRNLPRHQEVVAVIVHFEVQPVGPMGDQDLELTFKIIRGPSKGRRIRQHITLWSHEHNRGFNGRAIFNSLCRAIGVDKPTDSSQLHGNPLILRLTRKRGAEDKPMAEFTACSEGDRQAWEEASTQVERDDRVDTAGRSMSRNEHNERGKSVGRT